MVPGGTTHSHRWPVPGRSDRSPRRGGARRGHSPRPPRRSTSAVGQRHAALRSRSRALASVSRALATRRSRVGAARRSASLTVSFNVLVPSSALAAARPSRRCPRDASPCAQIYHGVSSYILRRLGVARRSASTRALDREGRGPDARRGGGGAKASFHRLRGSSNFTWLGSNRSGSKRPPSHSSTLSCSSWSGSRIAARTIVVAGRAAAILGRAGSRPGDADRILPAVLARHDRLQGHRVLPAVAEVVLVRESDSRMGELRRDGQLPTGLGRLLTLEGVVVRDADLQRLLPARLASRGTGAGDSRASPSRPGWRRADPRSCRSPAPGCFAKPAARPPRGRP